MNRRSLLLSFSALAAIRPAWADDSGRQPLLMPGKTSLFQRVIAHPGATLSPGPGAAGAKPIPGFSVFYVYTRQGGNAGWIEVGAAADGRIQGWMPTAKAIDWKHTMVAAFTNPAPRKPVLFLDSERSERLLMLDREAGAYADRLRAGVAAGNPGPVVAVEPRAFVDINRTFYLLPILDADLVERESGPPLRLLNVVSAPAEPPPPSNNQDALRNYKAAVVFLIDTTASMQPYIDRTRDAVQGLIRTIGTTGVKSNFRFGVVCYRDSLEDNPGLEYPTKIFAKPDFDKPPEAVMAGLDQVRESRVSSTGFDEDPLGGIQATLDGIDWDGLSARYIILITDAGARKSTHPHSLTRMDVTETRLRAQEKRVAILAMHLLTPEGARIHDHEPAAAQYRELTQFNGTAPLYFPIPNGAPAAFQQTMESVVGTLLQNVATATGVPMESLRLPASANRPDQDRMREQLRVVSEAMRLTYVGRVSQAQAPEARTSWTTDRDLADPEIFSLDIRVLLTRNQLSDLASALQKILAAGLAGRTAPETFFSELRAAFAAAATDPQRISQSQRIGGLLGEYLDGLPYKSEIMDIDQDSWLSMGPIQQRVVLNNVESRLRLYQEFQSQTELWHDLTHSGQRGEEVYPVPLEALP